MTDETRGAKFLRDNGCKLMWDNLCNVGTPDHVQSLSVWHTPTNKQIVMLDYGTSGFDVFTCVPGNTLNAVKEAIEK